MFMSCEGVMNENVKMLIWGLKIITEKNADGFNGRSLAQKFGTDYVCHRIIKFYSVQYNYQNLVCIVRIYHGTPRAPQVVCQ